MAQSEVQAARWLKLAADQNFDEAQFHLGNMYDGGRGVAQNVAVAIRWWRQAAVQGNAGAQVNLGVAYQNGRGVRQINEEAARWMKKAADLEHEDALYYLGVMYENGCGVAQSYEEAAKWYKKGTKRHDFIGKGSQRTAVLCRKAKELGAGLIERAIHRQFFVWHPRVLLVRPLRQTNSCQEHHP